MNPRNALLLSLAATGGSWVGYRAGAGPDLAETMWAGRDKPATARRDAGESSARSDSPVDRMDILRKLKSEDPDGWNQYLQMQAWEAIRSFTAEQCREGLEVTGTEVTEMIRVPGAEMLFFRWAELDPQAAMAAAQKAEQPRNLQFAKSVLTAWFQNDPEAAYRWTKSEPGIAGTLRTDDMMGSVLLDEPADSAMAKAMLLGEGVRERVFCVCGVNAGASGEEARAAFIKQLANFGEDERYAGMRMMLRSWGASEPQAVFDRWDEFGHRDRPEGRPVREEILARWGSRDPGAAMTWLDSHSLQDRETRQLDIYKRWAEKDVEAAGQWLEGRESAGTYAELLVKQSLSLTLNNPMDHAWSKQVAEQRDELLRRHYQLWERNQPEAAGAWLNQVDAASAAKIRRAADEVR